MCVLARRWFGGTQAISFVRLKWLSILVYEDKIVCFCRLLLHYYRYKYICFPSIFGSFENWSGVRGEMVRSRLGVTHSFLSISPFAHYDMGATSTYAQTEHTHAHPPIEFRWHTKSTIKKR